MRNKYKANCYICGKPVEIGQGYFQRVKGKGWKVKHTTGTLEEKSKCKRVE